MVWERLARLRSVAGGNGTMRVRRRVGCRRERFTRRAVFRCFRTFAVTAVSLPSIADHACRPDCGACCIAPSITSPIPGMPHGKPAGVRCVQLDDGHRCAIFGRPERPACCSGLKPQAEMCGASRAEAFAWLTKLEAATRPGIVG
jgi:hypothetical protein